MSYGLYDADLQFYPIPFYNLELMKLSTYYKNKREIVGLSPDFSPEKYTHFIVRQDIYSSQSYPITFQNIEYGGRAFNGDEYTPLPLEIEVMRPDISLYSQVIPTKVSHKYISAISTMQRAEHIRLSLDGATVWKDWEKQLRRDTNCYGVILHDYDPAAIDGCIDIIPDILQLIHHKQGHRLGMKFPAQIYEKETLTKWLKIKPMGTYYSLVYHRLIDEPDLINEILEIKKQSASYRQISLNITNELLNSQSISETIHYIFRTIINLRTQRLVFPLIYDNSVFTNTNWKMVMDMIQCYNVHLLACDIDYFQRVEPYETLYGYIKNAITKPALKSPLINTETMKHIFQFVRENNYDLFKDFYEYRGEEVRNDRRIN